MLASETLLEEIKRRALKISDDIEARSHTLRAEIDPAISPAWYVIITAPSSETLACKHLLRRSFGLFDPMFDQRVIVRGRPQLRRERLLPGYLLAFVWNIDAQWPRMASCPGVHDLLRRPGTPHAAVVPDHMINYLQGLEITRSLNNTDPGWADTETRKQKRTKRKNGSRVRTWIDAAAGPDDDVDEIVIRCKRYMGDLGDLRELAPKERISSFVRAMGLG